MEYAHQKVRDAVRRALEDEGMRADISPTIEHSPAYQTGDFATNASLIFAKEVGIRPDALAEKIAARISKDKKLFSDVSVAGRGFINMKLSDEAVGTFLRQTARTLGKGFSMRHGNINLEFISANPTGNLHLGHGRGAFYGDALARVLSYAGMRVAREYYINDSRESKQIVELGKTALGKGEQYMTPELKEKIDAIDFFGKSESEAGFLLASDIQKYNQQFIEAELGIPFDIWYSEDINLRGSGVVRTLFDVFQEKGFVYEKDGAWWMKTSEYGDDEDRVVKRSDGTWSYFMADIAYHADKIGRGYDALLDIWGADHHGHVKRMLAVKDMLSWDIEFRIFITQLVTLKEGGETKKMSKRAGTAVLLEDMVREVGVDALRWFYLEKSLSTHMEFDVALAKKQSAENPVYYVQYAHARAAGISENIGALPHDNTTIEDIIKVPAGRALAMKVLEFPEVVESISGNYFVHQLTTYAYELAAEFNQFYRDVRVIDEAEYRAGAAELVRTTKNTLAQTLALMGISAPEKM